MKRGMKRGMPKHRGGRTGLSRWASLVSLNGWGVLEPSLTKVTRKVVKHNTYSDFHVLDFLRESTLLTVESGIWVIPALVEGAIIGEAKRIRLILLRILRHDRDVRRVPRPLGKLNG
jgi:hypothetical protein